MTTDNENVNAGKTRSSELYPPNFSLSLLSLYEMNSREMTLNRHNSTVLSAVSADILVVFHLDVYGPLLRSYV